MRPFVFAMFVLLAGFIFRQDAAAQTNPLPAPGDPPVAGRIEVSQPDEEGIVTIRGVEGAVFPGAELLIRSLYTQQTSFATANFNGAFTARLAGIPGTPYWISPAPSIPLALRERPGAPAGGPGTIVYGPAAAHEPPSPVTALIIDGDLSDWARYSASVTGGELLTLLNTESLLVAINRPLPEDSQLEIDFQLGNVRYVLSFTPALLQAALLRQVGPEARDLGARAIAVAQGPAATEIRIPLAGILPQAQSAELYEIHIRSAESAFTMRPLSASVRRVEEIDGIVYTGGPLTDPAHRFSTAGVVAQGASVWHAEGRISTLAALPGETITLELDVTLQVPDLPAALPGLALIGEIALQPVVRGTDGMQPIAALHSGSGWSNLLTPSGLAISGVYGDVPLDVVTVPPAQVIRRGAALLAGFRFTLTLPDALPAGLYVPVFTGQAQIADGEILDWAQNSRIFGSGAGVARMPHTRLPVVLNVGDLDEARLLWALWHDYPSNNARGLLAEQDKGGAALADLVRFNSPTYILSPGQYPLEPYLPVILPNAEDMLTAPLLPLDLPGGEVSAVVTRPDGTRDSVLPAVFLQTQLSTSAIDERDRFGGQVPRHMLRLTTLEPGYTEYSFDQYGMYTVSLSGHVTDTFGRRYDGGGTYDLIIAEPMALLPGVLPGTPFALGDAFFPGGQVLPGVPADVQITVRLFPLAGTRVIERTFSGQANAQGYFVLDDDGLFRFGLPGEYVIDYEARYTGPDGRLWAASQRTAGVVAVPASPLIARGARGLMSGETLRGERPDIYRPIWFTTATYPPVGSLVELPPRPNYPYHAGDVALIHASREGGLRPVLHVQDTDGAYRDWLLARLPEAASAYGVPLEQVALEGALPLFSVHDPTAVGGPALNPETLQSTAYAYISAVRPGVTIRQFVMGDDEPALVVHWDGRDPYSGQIGAGVDGDRPGDYTFLFGGAVVRSPQAGLNTIVPYAALAVVVESSRPVAVIPPYNEPLLTVRGQPLRLFFHPTSLLPGQVLESGQTMAISGQAAPARLTDLTAVITAPSGTQRIVSGRTNAQGYFYDPAQDFAADEIGVWTVEISVTPAGETSAGPVMPPLPVGSVPGTQTGAYTVTVVPSQGPRLAWTLDDMVDMPVRPASAQTFTLRVPDGWQQASAYYTVMTPSYLLAAGTLDITGQQASHRFDPAALGREFPNLETDGRGQGAAASDVIRLTFTISGLDADGVPAAQVRTVTLFHDRLISLEGSTDE